MAVQFSTIEAAAAERKGGSQALWQRLPKPEAPETLAMVGDDRYLSVMSRRIFRAGLTHKQVDKRWPAFEIAFSDFDLETVAEMDDADIRLLVKDASLIRHRGKLTAVRDNAIAMQKLVATYGSFGAYLAAWPEDEIVNLWHALKTNFKQLGGRSAPAFLRMAGKDTFVFTRWVEAGLDQWSFWHEKTSSRKAHQAVQAIFNQWQEQTGYALCQLSQILAWSIDGLAPKQQANSGLLK